MEREPAAAAATATLTATLTPAAAEAASTATASTAAAPASTSISAPTSTSTSTSTSTPTPPGAADPEDAEPSTSTSASAPTSTSTSTSTSAPTPTPPGAADPEDAEPPPPPALTISVVDDDVDGDGDGDNALDSADTAATSATAHTPVNAGSFSAVMASEDAAAAAAAAGRKDPQRAQELLRTPQPPEGLKTQERLAVEESSRDEESTLEDMGSTGDEDEPATGVDAFLFDADREAHDLFAMAPEFATAALGSIDEDATLRLQDVVDLFQRREELAGYPVSDPIGVARILEVTAPPVASPRDHDPARGPWPDLGRPVAFRELCEFLACFGPAHVAMARARGSVLDAFGFVDPAFWGPTSKLRATRALTGKPPGSYLTRLARPRPAAKLIVSYVSRAGQVRHCGLTNVGQAGYLVRTSTTSSDDPESSTTSLFADLQSFLESASSHLDSLVPSRLAQRWNKSHWQRFVAPPALNAALAEEWTDTSLLHEFYVKTVSDAAGRVEPECARQCAQRAPRNENVAISCEVCGFESRAPASPPTPPSQPPAEPSPPPGLTNPDELDFLLRKGAERFRSGDRAAAEDVFRDVLERAEFNVSYQIDYRAEEAGFPPATNIVYNGLLQHNERAAWCKCIACSSLRAKARSLGNLGHIYSDRKKIPEAVELYEQSLPILRQMGMWKQEPIVLSSLTQCAYLSKDAALGARYGVEYMGTVTQSKDRASLLHRLEDLGAIKAVERLPREEVLKILNDGDLALQQDRYPEQAISLYLRAVHQARCLPSDLVEVNALIRAGCCLFMMNRLRAAIMLLERAVLLLRTNNASPENRNVAKQRVELHNLALSFVNQATDKAGYNSPARTSATGLYT